jgi:hypothetical protein
VRGLCKYDQGSIIEFTLTPALSLRTGRGGNN